jgi:hypothetical protein
MAGNGRHMATGEADAATAVELSAVPGRRRQRFPLEFPPPRCHDFCGCFAHKNPHPTPHHPRASAHIPSVKTDGNENIKFFKKMACFRSPTDR